MLKQYPLIGVSILAVVLLVLGSLSNVVGYQTVKSTTINDSPLFSTRTKRAINQESKETLASDYLGKGKNNNLMILPRLSETDSLRKIINKIQTMDDSSFERFKEIVINQLSKQEKLTDITPRQLITELEQIRDNPKTFMDYAGSNNGDITWNLDTPTVCWGFFFCLIKMLMMIPLLLVLFLLAFTSVLIPNCGASWTYPGC